MMCIGTLASLSSAVLQNLPSYFRTYGVLSLKYRVTYQAPLVAFSGGDHRWEVSEGFSSLTGKSKAIGNLIFFGSLIRVFLTSL